ncbi:VOC family protein [Brenneria izadpanahii]|uniref:VOC family protein n=1 Tax=Brenneria izadpanahii TaxID=2722756 RepID=UPI001AAE5A57|nr:VOC family protein [Brenneria izadpanahii]
MLDHLSIPVTDIDRSRRFYQRALQPLGYKLIKDMTTAVSFGITEGERKPTDPGGDKSFIMKESSPLPDYPAKEFSLFLIKSRYSRQLTVAMKNG